MGKGRVSVLLAYELNIDVVFILTAVDEEVVYFEKPTQRGLKGMLVAQLKIKDRQFPADSRFPKVESVVRDVTSRMCGNH